VRSKVIYTYIKFLLDLFLHSIFLCGKIDFCENGWFHPAGYNNHQLYCYCELDFFASTTGIL